jgi:hypothetical protein
LGPPSTPPVQPTTRSLNADGTFTGFAAVPNLAWRTQADRRRQRGERAGGGGVVRRAAHGGGAANERAGEMGCRSPRRATSPLSPRRRRAAYTSMPRCSIAARWRAEAIKCAVAAQSIRTHLDDVVAPDLVALLVRDHLLALTARRLVLVSRRASSLGACVAHVERRIG